MRRSLLLSFAQRYTGLLLMVPTIMIVSRLLTPAQIGVYSVAAAFLTLVHMLRDFGVSDYLVQAQKLDEAEVRSAFTITLGIAWVLAGSLFAGSTWIGGFFSEPKLGQVLQVLSISFLLVPFAATINALLQRSMQFGIKYRISVGHQVVQSALTVTLAALGFGTMSLAWGAVGGMVATVLGCLVWARSYWIKGLGLTHWRPVAHFGIRCAFGDLLFRLGLAAPDFIIGRMLGFTQVGLYSRGYGLINMFQTKVLDAIGVVAFPAFARDHRETHNEHLLFLKSMTYVTAIGWPFFAFTALMAFPIIRIMFGPQWYAAIPVLRLLSVAALIATPTFAFRQFFLAQGRAGLVARAVTIVEAARVLALVLAAFYGLYAVAASQVLVSVLTVFLYSALLVRHSLATVRDLWHGLRPCGAVTIATMIGPFVVYAVMPPSASNLWLPTILASAGACVGWLLGLRVCRHPLWSELENAVRLYYRSRAISQ